MCKKLARLLETYIDLCGIRKMAVELKEVFEREFGIKPETISITEATAEVRYSEISDNELKSLIEYIVDTKYYRIKDRIVDIIIQLKASTFNGALAKSASLDRWELATYGDGIHRMIEHNGRIYSVELTITPVTE